VSAGADWTPPACMKCGRVATRVNRLIGGHYCASCDEFITKPDRQLEYRYNRRVAVRKAKEVAS
jgi:hypothetical protein